MATDSNSLGSSPSSATLTINTSSPIIGSFALSPSAVTVGGSSVLTAGSVTDAGGTITGVSFYRESNGTSGLQIGSDTLVGSGVQNGTTWTLASDSPSLAVGTYTYYSVATDSNSISSSPSSATLTVAYAGTNGAILAWNVTGVGGGTNNFGPQDLAATTVASGVTGSLGLTRGSGVGTIGAGADNAWGGNTWASTSSAGITGNEFVSFGLTVGAGEILSLSAIDMNYRHSATGPSNGYWQYQINGGSWNLIGDFSNQFPVNTSAGGAITEMTLGGISGLQNLPPGTVVDIRVVPYGATSNAGTWYVYDLTGNDLTLSGALVTTTSTAVTSNPAGPLTQGEAVTFTATIAGSRALGPSPFISVRWPRATKLAPP